MQGMDTTNTRSNAKRGIPAKAMTNTAVARRTEALLQHFKGHDNEFRILHGIMCMSHMEREPGVTEEDRRLVNEVFNNLMIATRLDAINAAARAGL